MKTPLWDDDPFDTGEEPVFRPSPFGPRFDCIWNRREAINIWGWCPELPPEPTPESITEDVEKMRRILR